MSDHRHPSVHSSPSRSPDGTPVEGRRRLLKLMAASAALAGSGCSKTPPEPILPYVHTPEGMVPGHPVFYATTLTRNGYGFGVLVETNMGRPTKVEGNPKHPASLGATDVFAQAAILQLWDPDRSRTVLYKSEISTWDGFQGAMQSRLQSHIDGRGAGLRLLTGNVTSPTLIAQIKDWQKRFPEALWHQHDSAGCDAAQWAARQMFTPQDAFAGVASIALSAAASPATAAVSPAAVYYRLDQATLVVTLDADIFGPGVDSVRNAHDFMHDRNNPLAPRRLYAIEATPALCGALADSRLALPPHAIEALLWRLARKLGVIFQRETLPVATPTSDTGQNVPDGSGLSAPASTMAWENELARRLAQHLGHSLIVAGSSLSPEAHFLVWRLNEHLGNLGKTIIAAAGEAPAHSLAELVQAMRHGFVETLIMLGINPVYDAAGALDFAGALRRVRCSIHTGLYNDETARVATWHIPQCHDLEGWSDARSHNGVASIVQPVTSPLYGGYSPHEVIAMLSGDTLRSAHERVRRHWQSVWRTASDAAFDSRWQQALRYGVIDEAPPPELAPQPYAPLPQSAPPTGSAPPLTAIFVLDYSVEAGAFANNAWLQELPRPFTKMTWDNAALIGPQTAKAYAVRTGDIVTLQTMDGKRSVDAPLYVVPGHAEQTVSLPLGYGRMHAGSVGNNIGFNASGLQPVSAKGAARTTPVVLLRTGRQHAFAVTQTHHGTEGRNLVPTVSPGEPVLAPPPAPSLYPPHEYPGYAWGMSIDLNACIGCNACTIACQAENNIPVVGKEEVARGREMHWIRIDHYRDESKDRVIFQPVACQHCEDAPCEVVCPVGATMHDTEGLNVQVYNRCVGTRFCSNNCPYKVRRFNFFQYADTTHEASRSRQNPEVTVRQRGVMEKCTYCVQRISRARIESEKEGRHIRDGEIVTACEAVCPTQAITFGNVNDPDSRVSQAKRSPRDYKLLEELNTKPRTSYLARVVDPDATLERGSD